MEERGREGGRGGMIYSGVVSEGGRERLLVAVFIHITQMW